MSSEPIKEFSLLNIHKMSVHTPQSTWFPPPAAEGQKLGVIEDDMGYDERLFHYTYATRYDDVHF
jgi:hypothetical protein